MQKKNLLVLGVFIFCLFAIEIFLRQYYGFCNTVLIREDSSFEYIAQPNQKRFRFRNNVNYNSMSMRSDEIDTAACVILGFGDSVINGGVLTDQDSLATTILSYRLSKLFNQKIQFLNISAGSWGPDNCYAYLKQYGDFGAKAIFLFVSSHDAYDNMDFQKIVDVSESFPSKQYSSAVFELIDKYLIHRMKSFLQIELSDINNLGINKKKQGNSFNSGFASVQSYSKIKNIPLIIVLHADRE
jgi:hypothetical protein